MGFLTKADIENRVPIQRRRAIIRYGNGLASGKSLYLPRNRRYPEGEGIADIIGFITRNADTIKSVGSVIGNVAGAAGKIGSTAVDLVKKARELNQLKNQGIQNQSLEKILNTPKTEETPNAVKQGSGFYFLND